MGVSSLGRFAGGSGGGGGGLLRFLEFPLALCGTTVRLFFLGGGPGGGPGVNDASNVDELCGVAA